MKKQQTIEFYGTHLPNHPILPLNMATSLETGRLARARIQECYRNAIIAMKPGDRYAEGGILLPCRIPIEHGWLIRDGQVLDPTQWAWKKHKLDTPLRYACLFEWTLEDAVRQLQTRRLLPLSDPAAPFSLETRSAIATAWMDLFTGDW